MNQSTITTRQLIIASDRLHPLIGFRCVIPHKQPPVSWSWQSIGRSNTRAEARQAVRGASQGGPARTSRTRSESRPAPPPPSRAAHRASTAPLSHAPPGSPRDPDARPDDADHHAQPERRPHLHPKGETRAHMLDVHVFRCSQSNRYTRSFGAQAVHHRSSSSGQYARANAAQTAADRLTPASQ